MPSPRVTFAIFAYNHEQYVRSSVLSALAQTYSPLEILLSDDCSADDTFRIMEQTVASYSGPHRVRLFRNDKNIGVGAHFNRLVSEACGEIVVCGASDDISTPDRVERIVGLFDGEGPKLQCVWSNSRIIDGQGQDRGLFAPDDFRGNGDEGFRPVVTVVNEPWLIGATAAYRADVWRLFGPLDNSIMQEDAAMALRARLLGDIRYIPEVLVSYRQHGANLWDYANLSVAPSFDDKRARAARAALRKQARKDLRTARRLGLIGRKAFCYYTSAILQGHLLRSLKQRLAPFGPIPRWAAEQPNRLARVLDGKVVQKILLRDGARRSCAQETNRPKDEETAGAKRNRRPSRS